MRKTHISRMPDSLMLGFKEMEKRLNDDPFIKKKMRGKRITIVDIAHATALNLRKNYNEWEDELVEFLESDL